VTKPATVLIVLGLALTGSAWAQDPDESGDAEQALRNAEQAAAEALKLAEETGYLPGKVAALGWQAYAAFEARDWAKAGTRQAGYARAAGEASLPWHRLAAATLKGRIAEAKGGRVDAIKAYREAVREVEGLRAGLRAEAVQISFLRSKYEPYDRLILQLAAMEEDGEGLPTLMKMTAPTPAAMGLWYSEHVKARSLLDQLSGQADGWKHVPEAEREKLKPQEEELTELRAKLTQAQLAEEEDRAEIRARRKALTEAQREYARAREKLVLRFPRAAFAEGKGDVPKARQLIQVCQKLDAVGIVYHVGEYAAIGYAVDPQTGEVRSFGLPWNGDQLRRRVGMLARELEKTGRGGQAAPDLSELADGLLKEALAGIAADRLLCIVPDGELWRVPFAALPVEGKPLIERHPLVVSPSLSLLAALDERGKWEQEKKELSSLLAIGRPKVEGSRWSDLPGTQQEVEAISQAQPGAEVLLGEAAKESELKGMLGDFELIHFACHGKLDFARPHNSGLVLAQGEPNEDGYLTALEIADLDVRARLVTLSACDTGRGEYVPGEGLIGLTRAWLVAGAGGVCASLWPAADESTAKLMTQFYGGLTSGDRAVDALRAAQRSLAGNDATAHPFHWAGFELIGGAG
jgi:CHAT domain-containing protein